MRIRLCFIKENKRAYNNKILKSVLKNRRFSKDVLQYKNILKSSYLGDKKSKNFEILCSKYFLGKTIFYDVEIRFLIKILAKHKDQSNYLS